jgi:hypothetical protein
MRPGGRDTAAIVDASPLYSPHFGRIRGGFRGISPDFPPA